MVRTGVVLQDEVIVQSVEKHWLLDLFLQGQCVPSVQCFLLKMRFQSLK